MTIALSYLDDLGRVQITVTDLPSGTVTVERSPNGSTLWEPVRGGVELPISGGEATLDDYEYYAGAETHYRVVGDDQGSIVVSDQRVWLKSIRYPMLNRPITVVDWGAISRASRDTTHAVVGRSAPVAVSDSRLLPAFTLEIATDDYADPSVDPVPQAAAIELMLAAGGVLLVHVPAGMPVPGGYVAVGATAMNRVVPHGQVPRVWELPCQTVAPPGPDVLPTTLTWATIRRLYGSWTATVAAHPEWGALLADVGDPEDLVVI